jgi:hypothetical protein
MVACIGERLLAVVEKLHSMVELGRVCLSQIMGMMSSLVPLFPGNSRDTCGFLRTLLIFAYLIAS